ncbi:MAG: LamG domain-containing protein [Pirellulales bacterium]
MNYKLIGIVAWVAFGCGLSAFADTVAHWRWEEGPANTDVIHTVPAGQFEGTVPDVSGNGNDLSVWSQGGCCGYQYRSDVPFTTVPLSGAANNFSVKNTGGGPGMFTDSAVSMPTGVNLETMTPTAFTVEAMWKPENGGYRTVVGRDAQNVVTSDGALAALYLQAQPDNSMAFKFTDMAGNFHDVISPADLIDGFDFGSDPDGETGNWYSVVGVSDGTTLELYVNNALVASEPIVSADPRLAIGTTSGGDWHAGEWSVGRGLFGGGHTDRAYGFIDEVRISNSALTPSEFLVPPSLSLEVDTTSGEITLTNTAAVPVNVDFYRIGSAGGALSLAGWDSLDEQNYDAVDGPDSGDVAGDSDGEGWDEAGGSDASQLVELFVDDNGSLIGAGETLSLGNAYNTSIFPGMDGDLEFTFGLIGGLRLIGNVSYGALTGDYNDDGSVDAADYVVWRKTGINGQDGYNDWRANFGMMAPGSGSSLSNTAVPEPACFVLAVIAVLGGARRCRRELATK